jgi:hypothetical protein
MDGRAYEAGGWDPEPLFLVSPITGDISSCISLAGATTSLSDRRYGWAGGDTDHAYKTLPVATLSPYVGHT